MDGLQPRIVLLTGPSGCGKSALTASLGYPVVKLDNFYRNGDDPLLPLRFGIVDWDDPRSWDSAGALAALEALVATGRAEIPTYSIPTNSRTGYEEVEASDPALIVAEGIFAAYLIEPLRAAGLLAEAICLRRPRLQTFWFRLRRDLGEGRKPPGVLIRRGLALLREEPKLISNWAALGCRVLTPSEAEAEIGRLAGE